MPPAKDITGQLPSPEPQTAPLIGPSHTSHDSPLPRGVSDAYHMSCAEEWPANSNTRPTANRIEAKIFSARVNAKIKPPRQILSHLRIVALDVLPKGADHDHRHQHRQEHDNHRRVRDAEPVNLVVRRPTAVDVPPAHKTQMYSTHKKTGKAELSTSSNTFVCFFAGKMKARHTFCPVFETPESPGGKTPPLWTT